MKETKKYPEYDDMSYDDLRRVYDELHDEDLDPEDDSDLSRRFNYVAENLLMERDRERSGGRET